MKRKLTKKYSRHSCTIDLLTVLTLYVCATFMICIISLFLHCPHFGRRVHCTFTHHIGKNDISYDPPILWIWRTIYESVYICISRYVCLFKDVLKTLWFFVMSSESATHLHLFRSLAWRKLLLLVPLRRSFFEKYLLSAFQILIWENYYLKYELHVHVHCDFCPLFIHEQCQTCWILTACLWFFPDKINLTSS